MCLTLNHHGTIICSFNYPLLPKLQKKLNQPRNEKSSILLTTERKPSNPNWIEIKNIEDRKIVSFLKFTKISNFLVLEIQRRVSQFLETRIDLSMIGYIWLELMQKKKLTQTSETFVIRTSYETCSFPHL